MGCKVAGEDGSIVFQKLTRGLHVDVFFLHPSGNHQLGTVPVYRVEKLLQPLHTEAALPEHLQLTSLELNHSALDSELAPLSRYDAQGLVPEVVEDVDRLGRTHVREEVCTGGTDRPATLRDQGTGVRVLRRPQTHEPSLGSDDGGQYVEVGLENETGP